MSEMKQADNLHYIQVRAVLTKGIEFQWFHYTRWRSACCKRDTIVFPDIIGGLSILIIRTLFLIKSCVIHCSDDNVIY